MRVGPFEDCENVQTLVVIKCITLIFIFLNMQMFMFLDTRNYGGPQL